MFQENNKAVLKVNVVFTVPALWSVGFFSQLDPSSETTRSNAVESKNQLMEERANL